MGWEGLYEVSDEGRIRSLPRPNWNRTTILKPSIDNGYYCYVLQRGGRKEKRTIGRFMLEAFSGKRKHSRKMHAAHRNGNRHDNWLDNFYWATVSENHLDKRKHGTDYRGEDNHNAKITAAMAKAIIKELKKGRKQGVIAKEFNVTPNIVWALRAGKTWKHLNPYAPDTQHESKQGDKND